MKMSDVWTSGFDGVDFSYGFYKSAETSAGEVFKASGDYPLCGLIFSSEEPAKATMHAINNHDRMVEDIAELKDLVTLISLNSSFQTNMPHEADMVDKLLAKLNQEGEE